MPNGVADAEPVSWGRFSATMEAVNDRLSDLEGEDEKRRQRTWTLATIVLTSCALPILVALVLVWLHVGK